MITTGTAYRDEDENMQLDCKAHTARRAYQLIRAFTRDKRLALVTEKMIEAGGLIPTDIFMALLARPGSFALHQVRADGQLGLCIVAVSFEQEPPSHATTHPAPGSDVSLPAGSSADIDRQVYRVQSARRSGQQERWPGAVREV